jgi:hypothetical protein
VLKKLVSGRNFGNLVGVLLIVYALWSYFSDEIRIIAGGRKKVNVPAAYMNDSEQVMLAALGYVAFAVVAFLCASACAAKPAEPLSENSKDGYSVESPGKLVLAIAFMVIGLVLVGFRSPN